MNIDTQTIRRLKDALVASGGSGALPDSARSAQETGTRAALERVTPFIETMYLVMMADGEATDTELDALRGALKILTQDLLDASTLVQVLLDCEQRMTSQGVEARLQAIGGKICADRSDRETALSLAAAVALADDSVAAEENELLHSIAEWFGVSDKRCRDILQQF
ncbi:MAG: TerB family tellurite resistance protein [Halioglobus sp.]